MRGRKPGGLGLNRDGGEAVTLGQGMARLGLEGKRLAASPVKYLQGPMGHRERKRMSLACSGESLCTVGPCPFQGEVGLSQGPRGGVR